MTQMLDTFASNNINGIDYKLNEDLDNVNKRFIANKLILNNLKPSACYLDRDKD